VSALRTTKFLYSDFADPALGAANFSGASPPGGYGPLTAVAGYQLSAALHHSRHAVTKLPGSNGTYDIDLGAARDIEAFAMCNVFLDSGSNFPVITIWSSPDNSLWYSHGTQFDSAGWIGTRDRFYRLPAIYSRRYWRLQVATGTAWYVGKIFLGKFLEFEHGLYSPGSSRQAVPSAIVNKSESGRPVVHYVDQARLRFRNIYETAPDDFRVAVESIGLNGKPFVYVDPVGVARHVIMRDLSAPTAGHAAHDGVDYWDFDLEMEQLV
jgi:hypothetical protein